VRVLKEVSFEIERGRMICLLGPNGAGKTTLLGILATLLLPDSGVAEVDGRDVVVSPREVRERIGWVGPEEKGFYPQLTVEENLVFFAALFGISRSACRSRVNELLARWNWSVALHRPYQELSSGNKRRLALLRALLHDQPFSCWMNRRVISIPWPRRDSARISSGIGPLPPIKPRSG